MPSGWETYYVIFLSAGLALGMPVLLWFFAILIRSRTGNVPKNKIQTIPEAHLVVGRRLNTRFFMAVNTSLVLITLALLLVPCVGAVKDGISHHSLIRRLVGIISISLFAALGLLYSARKGDLKWLRSYRERENVGE